jgi:glycosyltransferase involved in cell wall biosynthesis
VTQASSKASENKSESKGEPRVLYSFPYRIGAQRICATAGHQVAGTAESGIRMTVLTGSIGRELPTSVTTKTTLAAGRFRVPIRILGHKIICDAHDWITSRWLERHASQIDVVHGWPMASLRTIKIANDKGIPFVLERPNAHTEFAYQQTAEECSELEITMPNGHDHAYDEECLRREGSEYRSADYLLCPSDFVLSSFLDKGFHAKKLIRHQYGYDRQKFCCGNQAPEHDRGLIMLYVGVCEPRKGLHYALQAWHNSGAQKRGKFLICGDFLPSYLAKLQVLLNHPSIEVLGFREDIPSLMKQSDLFVLSSVEEGSALVTFEAKAAGCVLLVSEATGAMCEHLIDSMVHRSRDHNALSDHIRTLDHDRQLLQKLRSNSIVSSESLSWNDAGERLASIYRRICSDKM